MYFRMKLYLLIWTRPIHYYVAINSAISVKSLKSIDTFSRHYPGFEFAQIYLSPLTLPSQFLLKKEVSLPEGEPYNILWSYIVSDIYRASFLNSWVSGWVLLKRCIAITVLSDRIMRFSVAFHDSSNVFWLCLEKYSGVDFLIKEYSITL